MITASIIALLLSACVLIWLTKKQEWISLALGVILFMAMDMLVVSAVGSPKQVRFEWFGADVRTIVHYEFDEGNAIYLMTDTPKLFKLPWSEEVAKQLQSAGIQAKRTGTDLLFRLKGDPNEETDLQFWAQPVREARPPKPL